MPINIYCLQYPIGMGDLYVLCVPTGGAVRTWQTEQQRVAVVAVFAATLRLVVLVEADGVGATRVGYVARELAVGVHAELRARTVGIAQAAHYRASAPQRSGQVRSQVSPGH